MDRSLSRGIRQWPGTEEDPSQGTDAFLVEVAGGHVPGRSRHRLIKGAQQPAKESNPAASRIVRRNRMLDSRFGADRSAGAEEDVDEQVNTESTAYLVHEIGGASQARRTLMGMQDSSGPLALLQRSGTREQAQERSGKLHGGSEPLLNAV